MDGGRVEDAPLLQNKETPTETATQSNKNNTYPYIPDGGYKNDVIKKIWDISNEDHEFLLLLSNENGSFTTTKRSGSRYWRESKTMYWVEDGETRKKYQPRGWYYDYGLCQVSSYYHPKYFDHIGTHWLDMSVDEQLDICYKLYKGGTKFYAPTINKLGIVFPNNK